MCNYMYQFRGNIERIVENVNKKTAKDYVYTLYTSGLIHIVEYNTLLEYIGKLKENNKF